MDIDSTFEPDTQLAPACKPRMSAFHNPAMAPQPVVALGPLASDAWRDAPPRVSSRKAVRGMYDADRLDMLDCRTTGSAVMGSLPVHRPTYPCGGTGGPLRAPATCSRGTAALPTPCLDRPLGGPNAGSEWTKSRWKFPSLHRLG